MGTLPTFQLALVSLAASALVTVATPSRGFADSGARTSPAGVQPPHGR